MILSASNAPRIGLWPAGLGAFERKSDNTARCLTLESPTRTPLRSLMSRSIRPIHRLLDTRTSSGIPSQTSRYPPSGA